MFSTYLDIQIIQPQAKTIIAEKDIPE